MPANTIYVAEDSDFTLQAVAQKLRALKQNPPDRVEVIGDEAIHVYFGDAYLKIYLDNGQYGRCGTFECDQNPDLNSDSGRKGHQDGYCIVVLLEQLIVVFINQFRGVVVESLCGDWWYRGMDDKNVPVPLPSHLAGWLAQVTVSEDDTLLKGKLSCPCGNECLEFHSPGVIHLSSSGLPMPCSMKISTEKGATRYWFGIKAVCPRCQRQCMVFDSLLHGADAVDCYRFTADFLAKWELERPALVPWPCLKCSRTMHESEVYFCIEHPVDFLHRYEGRYDVERYVDFFGWFSMDIKCSECGSESKEWVSYETR